VLLTTQQSYKLFTKHGIFSREICDKCGAVLGAIRFTRRDEAGVWCSRECRGETQRAAMLRPGRPRKYTSERERRTAKTRQQQVYRSRPGVEKTVCIESKTKDLQGQKSPLSTIPLTPSFLAVETSHRENAGARV